MKVKILAKKELPKEAKDYETHFFVICEGEGVQIGFPVLKTMVDTEIAQEAVNKINEILNEYEVTPI